METYVKFCMKIAIFSVKTDHVCCTSVRRAAHRLDELLDDELYQVNPVLADLEALQNTKYISFLIVFGVFTCSQILENDLRMDGK